MSKTVAIYVRVSTGKQADRDSIPFQIQECSNYVKHFLKTENFEVFKDAGRSGKNTHRPEYQRMIEKVKSGMISHVVVYKIDRISRNLVDFSIMYNDFKEHKVAFISLNEQLIPQALLVKPCSRLSSCSLNWSASSQVSVCVTS